MPLLNGMEATRQIREKAPATRILILSAYNNPSCIEQVLVLGATGYLIKKSSIHILAQAIRQVQKGDCFFDPSIDVSSFRKTPKKGIPARFHDSRGRALSSRETEVLKLIAEGFLNKQIADKLGISAKTSEKHRYSLMEKLGIHDIAGLTHYVIASGVAESSCPPGAGRGEDCGLLPR
jgi:DNA-binding NarL/FixJ family response regulator